LGCGFTRDPTAVEPKHYRLDFENDEVQVVSAHLGFTDENGKTREIFPSPGSRGGIRRFIIL
jgi:hypothetical protein